MTERITGEWTFEDCSYEILPTRVTTWIVIWDVRDFSGSLMSNNIEF